MSQSHPLALPPTFSPDTLDVLTHLSTVLSEVRTSLQNTTGLTDNANTNNGNDAGGSGNKKDGGGGASAGLTFKDVPRASDSIKHKLQRAREQVRALPDMQRTVEDQEVEIRELEARIERQRALLGRLQEGGLVFGKDDGEGAGGSDTNTTGTASAAEVKMET